MIIHSYRDVTLAAPSSVYKATQLPGPVLNKINSQIGLSSRPNAQGLISQNQIPGHVISTFSHFGPASPVIQNSKPRIRANFIASPFDPHHFSNPYSGHLIQSGPFGKNNFVSALHFPPNANSAAYQLTNTFVSSPIKPNSEALLLHPQKSNLPSLPTVPPSILSPFFQQIQQQQQDAVATAAPIDHRRPEAVKTSINMDPFKLLNDEYSVHLVPPPVRPASNVNYIRNLPTAQPTLPPTESPHNPAPTHDYYDEEHKKAMDILNKYNIPAISPLQDINRFVYNAGPFKAMPTATTYPTASPATFTTQQPNTFKNLMRRPENEFKQHKISHPSYSGAKYPNDPKYRVTNKPFLPTPDTSPDLAITHSFFTIEDAITLSPHLHYRRPNVVPTNTNQIEEIIRKPQEEQITEIATVGENSETDTTLQPPPSSSVQQNRQRNRNKVRRKRPRPSTESSSEADEPQHRNPMQNHRNKLNDEREEVVQTTMPKNHKAFSSTTRDRETLLQRPRDTTIDNTHSEVTTNIPHRNNNRGRNPQSGIVETFSDKPQKPKEQRRPNNRFEDNKIPRYRPQTTTKTSTFSSQTDESEATTVNIRDNTHAPRYSKPSRRPSTTHPAVTTAIEDDEPVTDVKVTTASIDTYPQTRLPPKTRIPTSQATTSITPTIQNLIIGTTQGHPEENSVVISTKIGVTGSTGEGKYTTEREFISLEEENSDESKVVYPGEISTQSTSTTTSSESPEQAESSKETMVTSDGPVYKPLDHLKQRPRLRQKEKLLEAAEKASRQKEKLQETEDKVTTSVTTHRTSSPTRTSTSTRNPAPKDRGNIKNNDHNEQNDITDNESERAPGNLRLPLHKGTVKIVEQTTDAAVNATKSNRLNGSGSNKYDAKHRPRFSVKEYRQRLSTSTSDPLQSGERESTTSSYTRLRFPTRNRFVSDGKNRTVELSKPVIDEKLNLVVETQERPDTEESSSEQTEVTRKRFSPKDRYSSKVKSTTDMSSTSESSTSKPTTRRGSTRRDYTNNRVRFSTTTAFPQVDSTNARLPVIRNASVPLRRPQTNLSLRQRIQNKNSMRIEPNANRKDLVSDESVNDLAVESTSDEHVSSVSSTEDYKHETAIMKIAKDDHSYRPYMHRDRSSTTSTSSTEGSVMSISDNDLNESPSHQSERVAELTIFGSNQFNTVNKGTSSRRIPGYFTIATEDPILPIEAFFPQVKRH